VLVSTSQSLIVIRLVIKGIDAGDGAGNAEILMVMASRP